jgi:hypothetical protein
MDVEDARDVLDAVGARRQEGRHEVLEHGVLGAEHGDLSTEPRTTGDDETIH